MVKVHDTVSYSQALWPRVMGRFPQGKGLSVNRKRSINRASPSHEPLLFAET